MTKNIDGRFINVEFYTTSDVNRYGVISISPEMMLGMLEYTDDDENIRGLSSTDVLYYIDEFPYYEEEWDKRVRQLYEYSRTLYAPRTTYTPVGGYGKSCDYLLDGEFYRQNGDYEHALQDEISIKLVGHEETVLATESKLQEKIEEEEAGYELWPLVEAKG